ncbi:ABC transporter permease [Thermoanaerobacterium butyriciformans]|uniref:NitT/TauT family transport system permease protein n=1 Tax=Thermoanaerobacterium butyriciformans TaxID=1702242 RepID=A0ABS4NFZ9_9THEO|nr:ABC transporter permease [Thermoanaerobacterium butyriciformans]MBP2072590.1 NitT/TauT family transport system permease protein [Thermoanaerobacterium butyriciformans]
MLIAIWELVYKINVETIKIWSANVVPSPISVFLLIVRLFKTKTLIYAILSSMRRLVIGYLISIVIGFFVGFLMIHFKYIEENFGSLILGLQTLPNLAWIPFAILWFGYSESSIIFVIAIGSIFSISLAVDSGIKNINPIYLKAAKTMGAKGYKLYSNVIIPAALPSIVSGLKEGWAFAWRGLISGEMLVSATGLGQILSKGKDASNISQVVAVMLIILSLGLIIDKFVFGRIERSIRCRWGLM